VNERFEIIQLGGRTSPYLARGKSRAPRELFKLARAGLLPALRAALQRAGREERPVRHEAIEVRRGRGDTLVASLEVVPIAGSPGQGRFFLVLFEGTGPSRAAGRASAGTAPGLRRASAATSSGSA